MWPEGTSPSPFGQALNCLRSYICKVKKILIRFAHKCLKFHYCFQMQEHAIPQPAGGDTMNQAVTVKISDVIMRCWYIRVSRKVFTGCWWLMMDELKAKANFLVSILFSPLAEVWKLATVGLPWCWFCGWSGCCIRWSSVCFCTQLVPGLCVQNLRICQCGFCPWR